MTRHHRAETAAGHCIEFDVVERSECIAAVEAKIHVERWRKNFVQK